LLGVAQLIALVRRSKNLKLVFQQKQLWSERGEHMTYVFAPLDYPGATGTAATGVDGRGDIVGFYLDASNNQHGFIDFGGTFVEELTPLENSAVILHAVNNLGAFAGTLVQGGESFAFFELKDAIVLIGPPNGVQSINANGINNNNWVVGDFFDGTTEHGFRYTTTGGLKILDDPLAGSIGTIARGINDNGQIVGGYFDKSGAEHGFLYLNGKWTTLDDKHGYNTECEGINSKGQIVGFYFDNGLEHSFVATKVNGKYVFTDIDDPLGVKGTAAFGINNHGEIVGIYYDAAGHEHGFHT